MEEWRVIDHENGETSGFHLAQMEVLKTAILLMEERRFFDLENGD